MGLFGNIFGRKNAGGLFQPPPPVMSDDPRTGGIGGFQVGMDGGPDAPEMAQAPQQAGKQKINWMGVLADGLAGAAGKEGPYSAWIDAQRTAQQNREAEMSDYVTKLQLKQRYETPKVNDTERDFEWFKSLNETDRALYEQMRPQYRQGPDGQFYRVQVAPEAPPQAAPAAPVGKLVPITGGALPSATPPFAGKPANGFVPPASLGGGNMTSGRRTVEGNRLVGGVPNSAHLSGRSADYGGPNLAAILEAARKLPGIKKAFIHNAGSGKHVHTEGEGWNVPYYGKNGTRGR